MKLQEINWHGSPAKPFVEKGGSKAGDYLFLKQFKQFQKHLPTGTYYLEPGQDIEKFLNKFWFWSSEFNRPKIVRACHPLDFVGMVDVIPSIPNVTGKEGIRKAFYELIEYAQRSAVASYMQYETQEIFRGDIGIFIQDYYGLPRFSILEHPHQKGVYRIGQVQESKYSFSGSGEFVQEVISNDISKTLYNTSEHSRNNIDIALIKKAIELYKSIYDIGLIPKEYSCQMEFGINEVTSELMFYQSRLFKPFSERANFNLEDLRPTNRLYKTPYYGSFGVTPPQGEEMVLAGLSNFDNEKIKTEPKVVYDYGFQGLHHSSELYVQPRNMAAYIPTETSSLLEHGHYRWLQRSPVSINFPASIDSVLDTTNENEFPKIKVYSNGFVGAFEILK